MSAFRFPAIVIVAVAAICVPAAAAPQDDLSSAREALVDHLERQGISDERVLAAMRAVPRHEFVPDSVRRWAYEDTALPIGLDQTISQPYIVALMSELLACAPGDRVLEIGTGSGYQAAVLVAMDCEVWSIEIVEELGQRAAGALGRLGYDAHLRIGDGYAGWPEAAPFDGVIVTAAPEQVPQALLDQLAPGGRMVIPVGPTGGVQELMLLRRHRDGTLEEREIIPVRFVPMVRQR